MELQINDKELLEVLINLIHDVDNYIEKHNFSRLGTRILIPYYIYKLIYFNPVFDDIQSLFDNKVFKFFKASGENPDYNINLKFTGISVNFHYKYNEIVVYNIEASLFHVKPLIIDLPVRLIKDENDED